MRGSGSCVQVDTTDTPPTGNGYAAPEGGGTSSVAQKVKGFLKENRAAIGASVALAVSVAAAIAKLHDEVQRVPAVLEGMAEAPVIPPAPDEEDDKATRERHASAHRMKLRPGASASQGARDAYKEETGEELPPFGETWRRAY